MKNHNFVITMEDATVLLSSLLALILKRNLEKFLAALFITKVKVSCPHLKQAKLKKILQKPQAIGKEINESSLQMQSCSLTGHFVMSNIFPLGHFTD